MSSSLLVIALLTLACGVAFAGLGRLITRRADAIYRLFQRVLGARSFPESGNKHDSVYKFIVGYGKVVTIIGAIVAILGAVQFAWRLISMRR